MLTLATPCDGIIECLKGEDEPWICDNKSTIIYFVIASVGLMIGVSTALKYKRFRRRGKNISKVIKMSAKTESLMNMLETPNSKDSNFWRSLNVMVLFYQWVLIDHARIDMSRRLFGLVVDLHGGNEVEAKICLLILILA